MTRLQQRKLTRKESHHNLNTPLLCNARAESHFPYQGIQVRLMEMDIGERGIGETEIRERVILERAIWEAVPT
jgi:hypothetical protein